MNGYHPIYFSCKKGQANEVQKLKDSKQFLKTLIKCFNQKSA